jgi:phage/plasmid-like protein (TIGR03299 family)
MAHNINRGNMAYVGEEPWHRLGKRVPANVTAHEMIKAAGLDWLVEKRPARGASVTWARKPAHLKPGADIPPDAEVRYNRYELVRPPHDGQPNETVLGIVSDRYEPLQNRNAFGFFDPIVDQERAFFETAGALGDGERIWVMARMPNDIEVVRGDTCQKYLLLSNTHTGRGVRHRQVHGDSSGVPEHADDVPWRRAVGVSRASQQEDDGPLEGCGGPDHRRERGVRNGCQGV